MDELHVELPGPDCLAGLHSDELGGLDEAMLLQLELDQPSGEAGAVDGHVHLLEHIGDGADVILVPVGQKQSADAAPVLDEIAHIGNHQVNAIEVVTREGHAAVHHDDLTAEFVYGHVLADLVESAKRDDFHFFCHKF